MKDSSMAKENLQVRGPPAVGMEKGRKGRWRLSRLKVSGLNFHDKTRQNASDHVLPKFTHFKSSLYSGRGSHVLTHPCVAKFPKLLRLLRTCCNSIQS